MRTEVLPNFFAPCPSSQGFIRDHDFNSPSAVPLIRLLNRMKLNPSGSSGQDPLPQAPVAPFAMLS